MPAVQGEREKQTQVSRHYSSWNRFEIEVHQINKPDQKIKLVMLRHGVVGWKLATVELPLD